MFSDPPTDLPTKFFPGSLFRRRARNADGWISFRKNENLLRMSNVGKQTTPLTREQCNNIKPEEVHDIIARHMLADGFDFVSSLLLGFESPKGPKVVTMNYG